MIFDSPSRTEGKDKLARIARPKKEGQADPD